MRNRHPRSAKAASEQTIHNAETDRLSACSQRPKRKCPAPHKRVVLPALPGVTGGDPECPHASSSTCALSASKDMDEIGKNLVWRQQIAKEVHTLRRGQGEQLAYKPNLSRLKPLPDRIGHETHPAAESIELMEQTLARERAKPPLPVTASAEYGWFTPAALSAAPAVGSSKR